MNKQTYEMLSRLQDIGILPADRLELRRISMTLHRWHELECGTDSGCIERQGEQCSGRPMWTYCTRDGKRHSHPIPDREAGALKRPAKIMARYPSLQSYVQGDPRGASLYILRPGDIPEGRTADCCYSNGIAVYK